MCIRKPVPLQGLNVHQFDDIVVTPDPTSREDCFGSGWGAYGFRSQGQCVRFVETGTDSR